MITCQLQNITEQKEEQLYIHFFSLPHKVMSWLTTHLLPLNQEVMSPPSRQQTNYPCCLHLTDPLTWRGRGKQRKNLPSLIHHLSQVELPLPLSWLASGSPFSLDLPSLLCVRDTVNLPHCGQSERRDLTAGGDSGCVLGLEGVRVTRPHSVTFSSGILIINPRSHDCQVTLLKISSYIIIY